MPYPKGFDKTYFLAELNKQPDLVGCRVVYFDDAAMSTLRVGPLMSSEALLAVVIRRGGRDILPTNAQVQKVKDQRFHAELLNLGLSCGGVVLSWVGSVVATGAAPVTGGLSLLVTAASSAATYTAWAQCAVALVRTGAEFANPELNIDMDNSEVYQRLAAAADIVGLAGAAAAGASTLRAIQLLKTATGRPLVDIIKGLSSRERQRLTEEILRSKHPGIGAAKLRELGLASNVPKRYMQKPITDGVRKQLLDVLGAMGNITSSATSGVMAQAASGTQDDDYIVGLARAYQTQ